MRNIKRFIFQRFNTRKEYSPRAGAIGQPLPRRIYLDEQQTPMTGLRAIEETIPSTLHTLFRSLRRAYFREAFPRCVRNKVPTKYDVCSHSYRSRHGGIIRDDGRYISMNFFFLFFKSRLTAHALSALCLGNTEYRPFILADRMLRRAYCVKAGKFTDDTYGTHVEAL